MTLAPFGFGRFADLCFYNRGSQTSTCFRVYPRCYGKQIDSATSARLERHRKHHKHDLCSAFHRYLVASFYVLENLRKSPTPRQEAPVESPKTFPSPQNTGVKESEAWLSSWKKSKRCSAPTPLPNRPVQS